VSFSRHHVTVAGQFSQQASRFDAPGHTLSQPALLDWAIADWPFDPDSRVLDVAAGTGQLTRAIAPRVHRVVAVDLTPQMMTRGRRAMQQSNVHNVCFERGLAERLPHPDGSFDMVVTRLSLHHFETPTRPLHEMVRVCRWGGKIGVVDLVAPDEPMVASTYNRLERLRDPSHVQALSSGELDGLLVNAGLRLMHTASRDVEVNLDPWLDLTNAEPTTRQTITDLLTRELEGLCVTGLRPFQHAGRLMFMQTWRTIVAEKIQAETQSDRPRY
jgi:ubiquinone/menaquinone biosynthesis C-methylase UbiE